MYFHSLALQGGRLCPLFFCVTVVCWALPIGNCGWRVTGLSQVRQPCCEAKSKKNVFGCIWRRFGSVAYVCRVYQHPHFYHVTNEYLLLNKLHISWFRNSGPSDYRTFSFGLEHLFFLTYAPSDSWTFELTNLRTYRAVASAHEQLFVSWNSLFNTTTTIIKLTKQQQTRRGT